MLERLDAAAIADSRGVIAAPASLLLTAADSLSTPHARRVIAVGSAGGIDALPDAANARRVDRSAHIVIPGLVNAHTHLDLTHIGPRPHDPQEGFTPWIDMVRAERAQTDDQIADAVRLGVDACLKGGTVAVGDIAGAPRGGPSLVPYRTLRDSPLLGVSFLEFFAIGKPERASLERVAGVLELGRGEPARTGVRLGIQPHAPNTCSIDAFRWAAGLPGDVPRSTHLAETPEEASFVARAEGPQRALLERLGVWSEAVLESVGHGRHPIEHLHATGFLTPSEGTPRPLVAHVNDAPDAMLPLLGEACVAYCPRASTYFDAPRHFGPHRHEAMHVALGTDSVINLPRNQVEAAGMSILDEMRLVHQRDGTDPLRLLAMATVNGAGALGIPEGWFCIESGFDVAGLVAVEVPRIASEGLPPDPLGAILRAETPPELLFSGRNSDDTGM